MWGNKLRRRNSRIKGQAGKRYRDDLTVLREHEQQAQIQNAVSGVSERCEQS
jgi:hypothetical protein